MATAVVANAPGGGGNDVNDGVESVDREQSGAVVDLMQIYPGYTNNLNVVGFVDEGVMEKRHICMGMCPVALRYYENIMLGLLLCISLTLCISIWTILGQIPTWGASYYFGNYGYWTVVCVILPIIVLLSIKLFVTLQFYRFRKKKDGSSIMYHQAGKKFYFSFYGDAMFSLLASVWLLLISLHFCSWAPHYACITSPLFEEQSIYATIYWLYIVPQLLYVIFGYFLVYKIKSSDFEMYYKHWAFGKFESSNDVTYCLNYANGSNNIIRSNTILCRRCGDCENGVSDCGCQDWSEQSCNGCCKDGVKCSLFGISVWQVIVSTLGLVLVVMGFVYMSYWLTDESMDDTSADYLHGYSFAWAAQYLAWGVAGLAFHFLAGYYGIRLISYKYACCSNANEKETANAAGERFHDLSIKAMKAYSALAVLYYVAFAIWFAIIFVTNILFQSFQVSLLIVTILFAFVSWLPFEGLKLIDTFIKRENYHARNQSNGINMDSFDFKNQESQNPSGSGKDDQAVIAALQVASK